MKFLFSYLFCLLTINTWAQQYIVDSLKALLPNKEAQEQAELYLQLAKVAMTINPPEAIAYTHEGEALLDHQKIELKSELYRIRAKATLYTGELDRAEALLDSATALVVDASLSLFAVNDTRSELYYNAATNFFYTQPRKTIEYTHKILALAEPEDHAQLGITYNVQAGAYTNMSQYDSALIFLDSSLYHLQQIEDSDFKQSQIAILYENKAAIYMDQDQYQKAADLSYKALDLYSDLGLMDKKANVFSNFSGLYTYLNDSKTAIEYLKRSIAAEYSNDLLDTINLSISYYNLGVMYINDGKLDTGLVLMDQVIPFYKTHQMYEMLGLCYIQKSFCYNKQGALSKAMLYCQKAADLKEHFRKVDTRESLKEMQAKLYRKTGELEKSKQLYQNLIDSMSDTRMFQKVRFLDGGIKTALLAEDYKLVYQYMQQKVALEDSLAAINNENTIRDLEIKYETREIQQQNEHLKREQVFAAAEAAQNKRLLYLSTGLAVLLVGLLLLLMQYQAIKNRVQNKELKFQLLRNQMNPHFLFNVLGAIQSFIYTSNPVKAADFLSSFAELVRSILDNSSKEYITIAKEVEWLENYVSLQALRFGKHLKYTIDIDPELQQHEFLIPPMLIQPVVENALEHGFKDIDYEGHLTIKMTRLDDCIEIQIEDNGVGFDPQNPTNSNTKHTSHATRITKERIALINRKHKEQISFTTTSIPQQGTSVRFHIPFYA